MRFVKFTWALAIEVVGVSLVFACSLITLPYVSSKTGPAATIVWGSPPAYGCCDHSVGINVYSAGSTVPTEWIFDFNGPTQPGGPGPYSGQTVEADYYDSAAQGWVVLSIIAGPGLPEGKTYVTPAGARFRHDQTLHYAALVGLLGGLVLTLLGAALVVGAVRRRGAPVAAIAGAVSPLVPLGGVPLIGMWFDTQVLKIAANAMTLVWIVSALVAFGFAVAGWREKTGGFARYSLAFVSLVSGIWIVWWLGTAARVLSDLH